MPVYNHRPFVLKALSSLLIQNFDLSECELIISDDASSDGSYELILESEQWRELRDKFYSVCIVRHSSNLGLIGNFDYLFSRAVGRVVVPFAGDDWLRSNTLSSLWALIGSIDIGMGFTNGYYSYENGKLEAMYSERLQSGAWCGEHVRPDCVKGYTKSLYDIVGLPEWLDAEGLWLVAHALVLGECHYSNKKTFHYRIHRNSITSRNQLSERNKQDALKKAIALRRIHRAICSHAGGDRQAALEFLLPALRSARLQRVSVARLSLTKRYLLARRVLRRHGNCKSSLAFKLLLRTIFSFQYDIIRYYYWAIK